MTGRAEKWRRQREAGDGEHTAGLEGSWEVLTLGLAWDPLGVSANTPPSRQTLTERCGGARAQAETSGTEGVKQPQCAVRMGAPCLFLRDSSQD